MLSVITYIRYSKEASRDTGVGLLPAAVVVPRLGSTSVVLGSGPPRSELNSFRYVAVSQSH